MERKLDGTTAVITGAGSGIGRETALLCARRGAALAVCDVNEAGLAETVQEARSLGAEVRADRVDVSDGGSVQEFAASVHERFGGVELLVNNAGIGVMATFLQTEPEDWQGLIAVNLMGVVHGCQSFVPAMVERGKGGHVVNVASTAGLQATPAASAYSATKYAVLGLSEALRMELRPHGIGVTAACPGVINTAIVASGVVRGEDPQARQDKLVGLYQRRDYGPEKVAVRILRAVERNRAVAPIAPEAHLTYALSRIAPPAARWLSAKLSARVD